MPPPRAENIAVAGLMESARADTAAGQLPNAAATLERALRIEPRNAQLWHDLAEVRLRQRDYGAGREPRRALEHPRRQRRRLRAANQRLIDEARAAKR